MTEPQVVIPVDTRDMTMIDTPSGVINVIHEMTLGDVIVSTCLTAVLIVLVLSQVMLRRVN